MGIYTLLIAVMVLLPLAGFSQGRGQNFVQQYVDANGHCHFTSKQVWAAFSELVDWVSHGKRPEPGLLPENPH